MDIGRLQEIARMQEQIDRMERLNRFGSVGNDAVLRTFRESLAEVNALKDQLATAGTVGLSVGQQFQDAIDRMQPFRYELEAAQSAKLAIGRALEIPAAKRIAEIASQAISLPALDGFEQLVKNAQASLGALSPAVEFAFAHQEELRRLTEDGLMRIRVDPVFTKSLELKEITQSLVVGYLDVFSNLEAAVTIPASLLGYPELEVFHHSDLIVRVWGEEEEDEGETDEEVEFRRELAVEVEKSIHLRLEGQGNAYLEMWLGARQARDLDGHDSIRHCLVSLRELVTHLIHLKSPDAKVRSWTRDPNHYDEKDRPTREARLRYIYRNIDAKAFTSFVDLDVGATLKTIQLLQRVHQKAPAFSRAHLDALMRRVDGIILMLLDASEN